MVDQDSPEFVHCEVIPHKEPISTHSFSIATLLLITTLTALILGTIMWERNIGIALLIVSMPALLRTMTIANRMKRQGDIMSFGEKILTFGRSLAAAALIAGAVGGTFVGVIYNIISTTPGSTVTTVLLIAIFMLAISGSLGILLIRLFWLPRK